ncbi:MAG: hypothetical protein RTU30_10155 [Candidatus Thorarchaeota archaeon]
MSGVRRPYLIPLSVLLVLLVGLPITQVSAVTPVTVVEKTSQSLANADNGHAYMYVDPGFAGYSASYFLDHEQDVSYLRKSYDETSWDPSSGGYLGPAYRMIGTFGSYDSTNPGWLGEEQSLPDFMEYINSTPDAMSLTLSQERAVFPLTLGQESTVVLEPGIPNIGVFTLGNEEFVHITVGSRQDTTEMEVVVVDENNRILGYWALLGGDVGVIPFIPSGPGQYALIALFGNSDAGLHTMDVLPQAITPQAVGFNTLIDGVLSGSEWDAGAATEGLHYSEKAPVAHTYKFTSNSTHPGRVRYGFNYPELDDDIYTPYEPIIVENVDAFYGEYPTDRVMEIYSAEGDTYHYQSFQGESYYLTFIGMDEVEYTLYCDQPNIPVLPVNQPFYHENRAGDERLAYKLSLGQDSVLKLNKTEPIAGYQWRLWSVFDDGLYRDTELSDSTFHDATPLYLPAGDYIIEGYATSSAAGGWYQFNIGHVLDGAGSVSIANGGLAGLRVPVETFGLYNLNISMVTHDNISVWADYDVIDPTGENIQAWHTDLGNREFGTSWLGYDSMNWTAHTMGGFSNNDMFNDGYAIIIISPYQVMNNTDGMSGNLYSEYTVDYNVIFEEYSAELYDITFSMNVNNISQSVDLDLVDPIDALSQEHYALRLTASHGKWMNVSIEVDDVTSWSAKCFTERGNFTQILPWDNLNDMFVGDYDGESSFQFGTIGEDILIIFQVNRELNYAGSFNVTITPMITNQLHIPTWPDYTGIGAVGSGVDLGASVPLILGGAGVVVVVIVVAYVVRRRRAL